MLNKIFLMGRLVRDPELRVTNTGRAVTNITIAVDRDFKDASGDYPTDFVDVSAWGRTADFVNRYFSKGRMILIVGRLESRKWVDKDGNNRVSWGVTADEAHFADSKRESSEGSNTPETSAPKAEPPRFEEQTEDDGELPF